MNEFEHITREDLHLAYRVVAALQDQTHGDEVARGLLIATAELLRVAYRSRTLHDPLPGQTALL